MFDLVNTRTGFPATVWSPFLVKKHKNFAVGGSLLLYISKYILTFAPDIVLTINYSLMKYKVSYTDSAGHVLSFITICPELFYYMRCMENCTIKSFTVSLHEPMQKGGQYEQQPE